MKRYILILLENNEMTGSIPFKSFDNKSAIEFALKIFKECTSEINGFYVYQILPNNVYHSIATFIADC